MSIHCTTGPNSPPSEFAVMAMSPNTITLILMGASTSQNTKWSHHSLHSYMSTRRTSKPLPINILKLQETTPLVASALQQHTTVVFMRSQLEAGNLKLLKL